MRAGPLILAGMFLSEIRRLRCRAHGAERYPSNILQWQTVYRVNDERHPIQDDFHPGRENDPSAKRKGWQEKLRHLEA